MRRRLLAAGLAATAVLAAQAGTAGAATSATAGAVTAKGSTVANTAIKGTTRNISSAHTTAFSPGKAGTVGRPAGNEIQRDPLEEDGGAAPQAAARAAASAATRSSAPQTPGGIVRTGAQLIRSFDGLNHYEQRTADNGNQFSLEPPDQALCVGKGYVVEGVNDAVRVDTTSGHKGGVMSLNKFFGLPSTVDRSKTPPVYGPESTDPTCVYDSSTGTFYFVMLELALDPSTGGLTGANSLDIAVTKNPLGSWRIYRLPVQDDGSEGTPVHPNCPCIGDYPHIGFDAHGFYITTNEYSLVAPGEPFNAAQVYAFDKLALARGARTIYVTQFDTTGADQGRPGFTLWPAHSPSGRDFNRARGGTEYFLSSNAAEEANNGAYVTSRQILVWTMTGTATLGGRSPRAVLHAAPIGVAPYSLPPKAPQKDGPAPLRDCLNDPTCRAQIVNGTGPTEQLAKLDANDTRMQQVMYAGGLLYGALDTKVSFGSDTEAGIAWYIVRPTGLAGRLVRQGQFGIPGHAVTYPAIGVTSRGKGVMAFTLSGANYYPSAAFASVSVRGLGPIQLAATGKGPEDGFTGYAAIVGPTESSRWGDYGAASVVGNDVWIASEYIGQRCTLAQYEAAPFGTCGGTRTALANWGTRISLVRP